MRIFFFFKYNNFVQTLNIEFTTAHLMFVSRKVEGENIFLDEAGMQKLEKESWQYVLYVAWI